MTKTRLDLNLLPLEMRKKMREIGKPLFKILTALALILVCTWGMGIYSGYRNTLDALRSEVKKRKPEIETIEKVQKQRGELAKEISEFQKITSGEVSKIEILKELTQILPSSVWVWNVKYSGGEIELSGFADSASELIPLLDKSPLFEKVEFLAPVTKERDRRASGEKERERFKIKMRLEGRRAGS
jgi:general secretion pathway protein L